MFLRSVAVPSDAAEFDTVICYSCAESIKHASLLIPSRSSPVVCVT